MTPHYVIEAAKKCTTNRTVLSRLDEVDIRQVSAQYSLPDDSDECHAFGDWNSHREHKKGGR